MLPRRPPATATRGALPGHREVIEHEGHDLIAAHRRTTRYQLLAVGQQAGALDCVSHLAVADWVEHLYVAQHSHRIAATDRRGSDRTYRRPMADSARSSNLFCRATLNFAARNGVLMAEPVEVDIINARSVELPHWDTCGFELKSHASAVTNWSDDDEVAAIHHQEMEELARQMTGCYVALVSSHITRGPEQAQRHQDLAPISFVHSDFARGYDVLVRRSYAQPDREGAVRALARNGVTAADVADASRLVILQFWRNVGPPKMDFPLAFCDARTVTPGDARPIPVSDYAGSGVDFNALAVLGPVSQIPYRWYAYPELRPDEVVAFRTYDTALVDRGATWFTPHSAFRDPDVEVGRPPRSSIELRAVCLYR